MQVSAKPLARRSGSFVADLRLMRIEGYHRQTSKSSTMILVTIFASHLVFAPSPLAPQNPDLVQALAKYEALDFRGALTDLQRAMKASSLSPRDMIETLAYAARIHAVLNNIRRAQAGFEHVLELDPAYELSPEESPRIREVFVQAQKAVRAKHGVGNGAVASVQPTLAATERPSPVEATSATVPSATVPPPPIEATSATAPLPPIEATSATAPPPPIEATSATAPAPPTESSLTSWLVVGGVATAIVVGVVAAILVGSSHEHSESANATWRLP